MILVWRGWGIVTPLIPLGVLAAAGAAAEALGGQGFWRAHVSVQVAATVLAGVALLWAGRRLNAAHYATPSVPRRHSFWFVPVEWWGILVAIAGPIVLLAG